MAIAQSTMDFSMMPMDDSVVDSPSNEGKHPNPMNLAFSLKCRLQLTSPWDHSTLNAMTPQKLYDEEMGVVTTIKVCLEVWVNS